ncbi:hypothetical protein B7755_048495 [Streptomyces sp. NBS 14/10]|uniref:hypothetical protein n=1 Tax=Streptomyces sp. NBS 14/10 TaxID=1945643 RepID=UPI00211AFAA4|nr:hypothetical protein [Streptomyces sp. NBS 14/10]KAK1185250.1 hypothetical protein B7755_048495 [Streptomyces sp. NBS 14/10]
MERHFRDGHTETWWAADARLGGYGPDSPCRLVVATTDPATLPEKATWYLATNLPHPDAPHTTSPHPPADLAEIIRLYGLRPWIEQSYKQIKDELGWADFQVRSDRAIRRHQTLVNCAFSFCWDQWFAPPGPLDATAPGPCPTRGQRGGPTPSHQPQQPYWPRALRAIRSWLTPAVTLNRWWRAWTDTDPPSELQALIDAVTTGHGIDLYLRI